MLYTHWAYFSDAESAGHAVSDVVGLPHFLAAALEVADADEGLWRLLVVRDITDLDDWHDDVETVVSRWGGDYDHGCTGNELAEQRAYEMAQCPDCTTEHLCPLHARL